MSPAAVDGLPLRSSQASLLAANPPHPSQPHHLHAIAVEVLHNLRHEHYWTDLCLHNVSPLASEPLSRPLISGLPPRRVYIHPDDQLHELKQGLKEEDVGIEREWVLPARLKENWSLQRFGEVFDKIGEEPEVKGEGVARMWEDEDAKSPRKENKERKGNRRGGKRVLLGTVGDDSTVVYYVVHDGIVKPRQN